MPFDTLAAASVADELHAALSDGRIQKIIQPSPSSVSLAVYRGTQQWLVLSADAQAARVQLAPGKLAKAFATPSPFVMLLRKYLEGSVLTKVEQVPNERIVTLHCRRGGETVALIAEIMGKHSNVILVAEERVLGAVKIVPPRQSRVRPIIPGGPYRPPPPQERDTSLYPAGPRLDAGSLLEAKSLLRQAPGGTPVRAALLGLLSGCSPFLADQIAGRVGVSGSSVLEPGEVDALVAAVSEFFVLYRSRAWIPCTFINARDRADFAPYLPLGVRKVSPVSSMSEAIEEVLGGRESRDSMASFRGEILRQIERERGVVDRKIYSLEDGMAATEGADAVLEQGQLLLAYQYAATPRANELAIPDLGITIPLNPTMGPIENADRLFHRYRKLRDAKKRLPSMIEEATAERDRLDDALAFARIASNEADLREIRREATGASTTPQSTKRGKVAKRRRPPRYEANGYTAIAGRSARENEEVTFRVARRDDLWFHVRERTGAHVILHQGGGAPEDMVEAAAALAAYFSEGRTDTAVDVDVTVVRNVRKIPGGPAGRVSYTHFRTIRVQPSLGPWTMTPGGGS